MVSLLRVVAAVCLFSSSALVQASVLPVDTTPAFTVVENPSSSATHRLEKRGLWGPGVITSCTVPNTVAITFDDGPYMYTEGLLNYLKKQGVKATFFMNGNNVGNIWQYDWVVKKAYRDGHQLGSHTWSHADLNALTEAGMAQEMNQLDQAFKSLIGRRPVYMRPPYGNVNDNVKRFMKKQGYKIVNWGIDTNDWRHSDDVKTSLSAYMNVLGGAGAHRRGFIALEHDTIQSTAETLIPKVVAYCKERGFEMVTVGTCLGQSPDEWYRS